MRPSLLLALMVPLAASATTDPRGDGPAWSFDDPEGDADWPALRLVDVNGDGTDDVVMHDPAVDLPGRFHVFLGPAPLAATPDLTLGTEATGPTNDLGAWGDLNGDGMADQVSWTGDVDAGTREVVVRWGSASGPVVTLETLAVDPYPTAWGFMQDRPVVTELPDIDGDGYGDVMMEGHFAGEDGGATRFRLFRWTDDGWDGTPVFDELMNHTVWDEAPKVHYQPLGDLDIDGQREVMFWSSSPAPGVEGAWIPSLTVHRGFTMPEGIVVNPSFWTSHALWDDLMTEPDQLRVLSLPDVTFDFEQDVLVQISSRVDGPSRAMLYRGDSSYGFSLDSPSLGWSAPADGEDARILGTGDFDGDGFEDLLLGFPARDADLDTPLATGGLELWLGTTTGWSEDVRHVWTPSAGDFGLGLIGGMGRVTPDGFDDLVVADGGEDGSTATAMLFAGFRDRDLDFADDVTEDCDPTDGDIHPGADEIWYDGVDQDCDGASDYDQDGDGWVLEDDCDDVDPARHPGLDEVWYDGIDQDCDGNDGDRDGDGYLSEAVGGDDCDDLRPLVNPGVEDTPDNGTDEDCDGVDATFASEEAGCEGCSSGGARGGGALVGLLALVGLRRRRD